jgi:hypothetical protein
MKPRAADLLTVDQAAALLIRRADAARFVRRPAGRPRKVKG